MWKERGFSHHPRKNLAHTFLKILSCFPYVMLGLEFKRRSSKNQNWGRGLNWKGHSGGYVRGPLIRHPSWPGDPPSFIIWQRVRISHYWMITAVCRPLLSTYCVRHATYFLACLANPHIAPGGGAVISVCRRAWDAQRLRNWPRITLVISDRVGLWSGAVWWQKSQATAACIRPLWCWSPLGPPRGAGASSPWSSALSEPSLCCCFCFPSPISASPPSSPSRSSPSMPQAAASLSYDITRLKIPL